MKNLFILFFTWPIVLFAQDCWKLAEGQSFKMRSQTWANTLPTTVKKWDKKKPEDRALLVREYNTKIGSGAIAPWMDMESNFKITDVSVEDGVESLSLEAFESSYEYATTNFCYQDTMYLVRNAQVLWRVHQGDTLGLAVQGIQRIPLNLHIGDNLPVYKDYSITLPETWNAQMSDRVFAYAYTDKSVKTGHFTDTNTGEFGYGAV